MKSVEFFSLITLFVVCMFDSVMDVFTLKLIFISIVSVKKTLV